MLCKSCEISWFFTLMKKQKMNRRYIVVTPCRNEEKNLPNLVQSITVQALRPALWVIVDDGSTDRTGEIIREAEEKYGWVKEFYSGEHKEFSGVHNAAVCNMRDLCRQLEDTKTVFL